MTVTREDIVAGARSWIGTPYRDLGRDRHGMDCVGLIVTVYTNLGLINYEVPTYSRIPDGSFLNHFFRAGFIRINPTDRLPGDAVAFKMLDYACHCGIVTPTGVVHAYSLHKGVFEQIFTAKLRQTLVAAYRAPGIA